LREYPSRLQKYAKEEGQTLHLSTRDKNRAREKNDRGHRKSYARGGIGSETDKETERERLKVTSKRESSAPEPSQERGETKRAHLFYSKVGGGGYLYKDP